jgi:hypothetical protein
MLPLVAGFEDILWYLGRTPVHVLRAVVGNQCLLLLYSTWLACRAVVLVTALHLLHSKDCASSMSACSAMHVHSPLGNSAKLKLSLTSLQVLWLHGTTALREGQPWRRGIRSASEWCRAERPLQKTAARLGWQAGGVLSHHEPVCYCACKPTALLRSLLASNIACSDESAARSVVLM